MKLKQLLLKWMRKLGWVRLKDLPPIPRPKPKPEIFYWQKLQMRVEINHDANHFLHDPEQYMKAITSDAKKELLKGVDQYIESYLEDHGRYLTMVVYVAKRRL